jgi:general secretion pathway protein D
MANPPGMILDGMHRNHLLYFGNLISVVYRLLEKFTRNREMVEEGRRVLLKGALRRAVLVLLATLVVASCDRGRSARLIRGAEIPVRPPALTAPPAPARALEPAPVLPDQVTSERVPAPRGPDFVVGSGEFVDRMAAEARPVELSRRGDITFNFVDANIREVVRAILGDELRANYIIDPKVQGTVTVQTSRPMAREALVGALEEILRLSGAALVRGDGLYEIVPAADAPRRAPPPTLRPAPGARVAGFAVRIVPLRFVAAAEMAKILEPVAPQGSVLRVDEARNLLMLSGTERELENLLEMIDLFDVDWLAGTSFALYPLEAAGARDLVSELETILGGTDGPLAGLVRLVPIERINTVLVITPRAEYLAEIGKWIERLDRGGDSVQQRLYVYYVQNGRAADLAAILDEIFSLAEPRRARPVELAPGLTPAEITGRGARAPARTTRRETLSPARQRIEAQRAATAAQLERIAGERSPTRAGAPATTTPGALAPAPAPRTPRATGEVTAPQITSDIRIIADEANNALVILATPQEYRQITAALAKLDIVPLQVLIEATIAEVTLNDELRYGVQWFIRDLEGVDLTLSEVAEGVVAQAFPGFSAIFSSGGDPRVVLNALASVTDVNVISSPQIMVLDNQTAFIQVGDQVPIAIQQAISVSDPEAPIVNSIEFRDTGIILTVTPRVNASGLVTMEIQQEVSDVAATTTSGIDSPTIQQRRIESTIAVQSGATVVLGGLIRDRQEVTKTGVPLLQNIPFLGALFRDTASTGGRTEILVLITPRVVRSDQEARDVTEELKRRFRALVPLGAKIE